LNNRSEKAIHLGVIDWRFTVHTFWHAQEVCTTFKIVFHYHGYEDRATDGYIYAKNVELKPNEIL
jgi:hypothetical protein